MAEDSFGMGYALGADSNNGGMFGGGDGWWGIILLALLFGWGGNGFGGNGGGGMNAGFAWQNIDGGIRAIQNGISDATYALNNTIVNGFHGVDNQLCGLSRQMSDCCCDIKQTINNSTREVLDFLTQDKISTLQNENQALRFQASQVAQNQFITQVGSDIVNRLQPPPVPAYQVPNPYAAYGYGGYNAYGNCGCGC